MKNKTPTAYSFPLPTTEMIEAKLEMANKPKQIHATAFPATSTILCMMPNVHKDEHYRKPAS